MKARRRAVSALVVVVGAGLALTSALRSSSPAAPPRRVITDYDFALAGLQNEIAYARGLADALPSSWTRWADLAGLLLQHARLTSDHESQAAAERALDRAQQAVGHVVPRLEVARATLLSSVHRFEEAERALGAIDLGGLSAAERAASIALRGDVALARGRYAEALARYEEALALDRSGAHLARLAFYRDKTGDRDAGERLYREALESTPPSDARQRAWLFCQRGRARRDRGRYAEARRDFEAADRAFSGWPFVRGQLAEVDALTGRTDEAIAAGWDLVEKTGSPEAMDALSRLLRPRDRAEADRLVARARQHLDDHLRRFPEASSGHALGHFLVVERDASRALELARQDHARRPSAETGTRLAQALLLAGETAEARAIIDAVLATPWRSADVHATAALAYERSGDPRAAARERSRAIAIRPDALEQLDWLGQR